MIVAGSGRFQRGSTTVYHLPGSSVYIGEGLPRTRSRHDRPMLSRRSDRPGGIRLLPVPPGCRPDRNGNGPRPGDGGAAERRPRATPRRRWGRRGRHLHRRRRPVPPRRTRSRHLASRRGAARTRHDHIRAPRPRGGRGRPGRDPYGRGRGEDRRSGRHHGQAEPFGPRVPQSPAAQRAHRVRALHPWRRPGVHGQQADRPAGSPA